MSHALGHVLNYPTNNGAVVLGAVGGVDPHTHIASVTVGPYETEIEIVRLAVFDRSIDDRPDRVSVVGMVAFDHLGQRRLAVLVATVQTPRPVGPAYLTGRRRILPNADLGRVL